MNQITHEDVRAGLSERARSHLSTGRDMLAQGESYSQEWTDPGGQIAYYITTEQGVVIDNGEERPNTPADHSVSQTGPFGGSISSTWTTRPWTGWRESIRWTIRRGPPTPVE
jgi:hypothetical protein